MVNITQGTDSQLNNFDGVDMFHLVVHHLFDLLGTLTREIRGSSYLVDSAVGLQDVTRKSFLTACTGSDCLKQEVSLSFYKIMPGINVKLLDGLRLSGGACVASFL